VGAESIRQGLPVAPSSNLSISGMRKNILIYLALIIVFGLGIYGVLALGSRFTAGERPERGERGTDSGRRVCIRLTAYGAQQREVDLGGFSSR
jgi:hypothetical protein